MKLGHFIGLLCTTLALLFAASSGMGEPRYDTHNDLIRPGAEEFTGNLDSIKPMNADGVYTTVVINDTTFTVDSKAIFRTQGGSLATLDSFHPGMTVKFFALDSLLTKMWPVAEQQTSSPQPESSKSSSWDAKPEKKIRKENGVWKN